MHCCVNGFFRVAYLSGFGVMAEVIRGYGHDVCGSDIRVGCGYGVGGVDYLKTAFNGYDAIITNPPFNR